MCLLTVQIVFDFVDFADFDFVDFDFGDSGVAECC